MQVSLAVNQCTNAKCGLGVPQRNPYGEFMTAVQNAFLERVRCCSAGARCLFIQAIFCGCIWLADAARAAAAQTQPQLHPRGSTLPFTHQGPFVTTADGGVLCLEAKHALRSLDEGRTWNSTPLFAASEKFNVSNERALLRAKEGVIISAWMNGAERKAPKRWRWGEPGVSWRGFELPTYTCRSTDDGQTWETPVKLSDLDAGMIPVFVPPPKPEPKPGGIIMFGDSTTAPRSGVKQVYAVRVERALQSIGSSLSVHNAGIGGNTTRDALKRFERDVLRYKPRIIVMQFGINDAAVDVWQKPPATEPRVPREEYLTNLRSLVTAAQKQKSKIILMTTNPVRWTAKLRELYGKPPYRIEAEEGFDSPLLAGYNEALRRLSGELSVSLVDVRAAYPGFAERHQTTVDGLLLDGMHPNDLGQQLVAELLVPAIRDALR